MRLPSVVSRRVVGGGERRVAICKVLVVGGRDRRGRRSSLTNRDEIGVTYCRPEAGHSVSQRLEGRRTLLQPKQRRDPSVLTYLSSALHSLKNHTRRGGGLAVGGTDGAKLRLRPPGHRL